jgi:hypothetical protein
MEIVPSSGMAYHSNLYVTSNAVPSGFTSLTITGLPVPSATMQATKLQIGHPA